MEKKNYTLPPTYHLSTSRGAACFLEPPGHPRYFVRSIYTGHGNGPRPGLPQYELHGRYFTELEDVDKLTVLLPIDHERTQAWIGYLFKYMHGCYHDESAEGCDKTLIYPVPYYKLRRFVDDPRFSDEWRAKEQAVIAQANEEVKAHAWGVASFDTHGATRLIRRDYPDWKPSHTEQVQLVSDPPESTGNWWERMHTRPAPEDCPGEDWQPHPVNGAWCQVCGWHKNDSGQPKPVPVYVFTISSKDFGRYDHKLRDAIGPMQLGDVGKMVYDVGGVYQVENDEQRDRRLAAGKGETA